MRVLTYVHDHAELSRIVGLMHEKGIPTFTRHAGTRRGPPRWLIFVCLNSQADDARRILHDPDHVAAAPVNVDTFERAAYTRNMDVLVKWGSVALIAAVLFFVAVFVAIRSVDLGP